MAKKKGDYKIPFDEKGNQLDWADPNVQPGRYWGHAHEWVDNFVFEDELTYTGHDRGRSSATLIFKRKDGRTVSIFLTDADEIIPHVRLGKIVGKFTFCKRGTNFGCRLVEAL